MRFIRTGTRFLGTLDRSAERSRASPRSGRSKGPSDDARPRGGVTRKGEPSGPGYAGHILRMCRRPLCPFLRCMKFLLMQRLTCPIRRFSGFTGGEMNFHIVCGEATHGGKLCGVRAADGWSKIEKILGRRTIPGSFFSGHRPLCDTQARTRSLQSEPQSSPLVILSFADKKDAGPIH